MNLTPEERQIGQDNYHDTLSVSRRDFLKGVVAAGAVSGAGLGAMYFGYSKVENPVRVGIIGTGDEGQVLIGGCTPEYIDVVAISDIRPYNIHRAFHGDWGSDAGIAARPGLIAKGKHDSEKAAREHVKVYTDYKELLADSNVEAVIVGLPLFQHAEATVAALQAGKHVLTEKLMAHNVAECKVMGRVANNLNKLLAVGHQRHYSVLYDNAVNLLKWGVLGELHHIRAQWHRGNLPGKDSWQMPLPGGEKIYSDGDWQTIDQIGTELKNMREILKRTRDPLAASLLEKKVAQWEAWTKDADVQAENYGYEAFDLKDGRKRSALEELIRWRLWQRTGGGLMAELGSHQLDACSIFCTALRRDGKKAHPLSVHAVGGRHTFPLDRQAEDHVYCTFEFPGPGYDPDFPVGYYDESMNYPDPKKGVPSWEEDPNKRIVVTYSSINGNGFGGYGETVMGTRGTLVLDKEQEVLLYKNSETTTRVGVKDDKGGPTLDTQASGKGPSLAKAATATGPVSRGYTEEIEHWAWCIRNPAPENQPRCRSEIALGDAVIALTCNVAMEKANKGEGGYIKFEEDWYDLNHDATPDGSDVKAVAERLGADLA
ncbi:MAG: Gfo/Idh/MocA family oxidoreductase [Pirellulaceae bacterium]